MLTFESLLLDELLELELELLALAQPQAFAFHALALALLGLALGLALRLAFFSRSMSFNDLLTTTFADAFALGTVAAGQAEEAAAPEATSSLIFSGPVTSSCMPAAGAGAKEGGFAAEA